MHRFLPEKLKEKLPSGWNDTMFWTAALSGGKKIYFDYCCEFKTPKSYQPKVKVAPEFQLSPENIKFFYENGYLGPFKLMSEDEAENLREYLLNSVVNTVPPQVDRSSYKFEETGNIAEDLLPESNLLTEEYKEYFSERFKTLNRHLDNSTLLALFKRPEIVERCAQLLGPNLLLWRSRFFEIYPHSSGTQWHQNSNWLYENMRDSVVNPSDSSELFQLTCWIALTDANKEKGSMMVIPGTHQTIYPIQRGSTLTDDNNLHLHSFGYGDIDYPIDNTEKKLIEMKAGEFFLFTERVIHGSCENTTDSSRWAVNFRLVKTDTRIYTEEMLEKGHKDTYHNVKNLCLDYWKAVLVRGEDHFGYNRLLK
ncbi:hypothetical protein D5R40_15670 [Okeania hirsuta]|uniref:Phytanoyl-CoA dioxygenase family protein n=1 Tax=Okeania hirsuta TaxID=1458930 RepID=A0A3N6PBG8_9CYAN|nr:phytanoyl-CoA dioxygenase family protein [Okeania hirsuta]RQH40902.1 hypothetical protein D5R40_15670 [Okeania hirsuta]